ncbi:MAG: cupin domain-containing protein [Armatimonadetes bacterium]|nr:cupin domain-containing protein [Armatimonadota bacterium]
MARVTVQDTGKVHTSDADVAAFLKPYGIDFERWALDAIPQELLDKPSLTPEEKQRILDALAAPIEEAKKKFNYQSADVVALWPELPNLDGVMQPFQKEHYHTENEIRLCVDGGGIFSINPQEASVFHIEMQPGELISVPAGTWHWFNLTEGKRIKAVRVFESQEGWAAIYPEEEANLVR